MSIIAMEVQGHRMLRKVREDILIAKLQDMIEEESDPETIKTLKAVIEALKKQQK
jgi:hypothetical protein